MPTKLPVLYIWSRFLVENADTTATILDIFIVSSVISILCIYSRVLETLKEPVMINTHRYQYERLYVCCMNEHMNVVCMYFYM